MIRQMRMFLAFLACLATPAFAMEERAFDNALLSPGNCAVAVEMWTGGTSFGTSLLEMDCEGKARLRRDAVLAYRKSGSVTAEYEGMPFVHAFEPADVAAFLALPARIGVSQLLPPHGRILKLAVRRNGGESFHAATFLDTRAANRSPATQPFERVWNTLWDAVDTPTLQFR